MRKLDEELVFQIIKENRDEIRKFGISEVGLFGSFVRGKQKEESDIDLLVKFFRGEKTFRNFINFSEYIEKVLGRKVEVLTPESMSLYIAPYIESEIKYVQI